MKFAILAAGGIARKMAEAVTGIEKAGTVRIQKYAVASRDLSRAEEFAKEWGFEKAYGSYEELAADPEVELVYVASPHSHHYEHAKLCLEHGKHVLVEKAFTVNAAQAEDLMKLAREKQVLLTEAIWTRYMPMVDMIKEVLSRGMIGRPMFLSANLSYELEHVQRLGDPALAGGSLLDLGVYPINFASVFFGTNIAKVSSFCTYTETGVDRQETITIQYTDGRVASLTASHCCAGDRKGIIQGTEGFMVIENINNYESFTVYNRDGKKLLYKKAPKQITGYEYEVEACMQALKKGALECPQMPHRETIRVMEFMDELRKEWGVVYPFEKEVSAETEED